MYIAIDNIEKLAAGGEHAAALSPEAVKKTLDTLRAVLWVSATAALAAGLALSYSIMSPVRRFMQDSGTRMTDGGGAESADVFGILGRDFSMMMSSLGRYVSILESMSGGVIVFDRDGRVTAVNPSGERILTRRSEALLGRPLADVCRTVVRSPDLERVVLDGLRHGKAYSSEEVRISTSEGRDTVVGITTSLLTDENAKPSVVVANFMDLTSIKRMHEDLQERLRMASLGRLAAGVAHEVRNPLGAIRGMAQLIQEGLPDSDPRKRYGSIIEQEADRLNKVVEDLLGLAHGPAGRTPCDINALLAQGRVLASHGLSGKQAAVLDETENIPGVIAECGRLVQAFLNIFLNAFEAVANGGRVRYKTTYLPESRMIAVEIGNTGQQISPSVKERMFDPFFTTKERGSGLGLTIAHQIIVSHGGSISAESTPEETVFRVMLPAGPARDEGGEKRDGRGRG